MRAFHRPARLSDQAASRLVGGADVAAASELAHHSAALLMGVDTAVPEAAPGIEGEPDEVIRGAHVGATPASDVLNREVVVRAARSGDVDALAHAWADSPADTLPGALWRLLLLREWIARDEALVASRYASVLDVSVDRAAQDRFESLLASGQARPAPSVAEIRSDLDGVLSGSCPGLPQLGAVLARAAACLVALAAGSDDRWIEADSDRLADVVTRRESALTRTAAELEAASVLAYRGQLF